MFRPVSPITPVMTGNVLRPVSPMLNAAPVKPLIPYLGRSISPVGGAVPLVGPNLPPPSIMHPGPPPQHVPILLTGLGPNYLSRWNNKHTSQFDDMKKYMGRLPDVVINKPGGMAIWKEDKVTHILNDHNENGVNVLGTPKAGMVSTIVRTSIPVVSGGGVSYDANTKHLTVSSNTIGNTIKGLQSAAPSLVNGTVNWDADNKGALNKANLIA